MSFKFNFNVDNEGDVKVNDHKEQEDVAIQEIDAVYIEYNETKVNDTLLSCKIPVDTMHFQQGHSLKKLSRPTDQSDPLSNVLADARTDLIPGVYEAPSGKALLAAKSFYFGVGGSVFQFKQHVATQSRLLVRDVKQFKDGTTYASLPTTFPTFPSAPPTPVQHTTDEILSNLAGALKFKTISYDPADTDNAVNYTEYTSFMAYLPTKYPRVHSALNRTLINTYSMLYKWQGSDSSLLPLLINSHYDVVPATDGWTYPPYNGTIVNGTVWGRGAIDNKLIIISSLEAIDQLLVAGYVPKRTVYLAFGHDEEIGGTNGHLKISQYLQSRGVTAEAIVDEGMPILLGGFLGPIMPKSTAIIGINEKGYIYFTMTATAAGGHSAMPPPESAIGILAKAIEKLENNQLPIPAVQVTNGFLESFTPATVAAVPFLDFMRRTTTAITMVRGGIKPNVLATSATVFINHRVVPGDDIQTIINRNQALVNDPRITFDITATLPASPTSDTESCSYLRVKKALKTSFGSDINVLPGLMIANTDTRHYWNVSSNIYRIVPTVSDGLDFNSIHGVNEKMSSVNLVKAVQFYKDLIERFNTID
eukprot:gene15504-18415_t